MVVVEGKQYGDSVEYKKDHCMEKRFKLHPSFLRNVIKKVLESNGVITEVYRSPKRITQDKKVYQKPYIQKEKYKISVTVTEGII